MFSNILGSIDHVTNKISLSIDDKKSESGHHSLFEETEKLKSIKMTPIKNNHSFTDF